MRKIWKEIEGGRDWIVDADLKDFFGSVDHDKLLSLIAQRIADGRVLSLIKAMLKAGSFGKGRLFPSERGTPQGGVASPLLSNILLTPFDREMRLKGYQLTRYADDWVITCSSQAEARAAIAAATKILSALGVQLHPQKTRIVHVRFGFEFLGYKIKRGRQLSLPAAKIRSGARSGALYAYPREKSVQRFMDQVRRLTKRCVPLRTRELIGRLNPILRGLGALLQALPRPENLQPAQPMDRAAHLVASFQALAQHGLEGLARGAAVWRVRVGQSCATDTFYCVPACCIFVKAGCRKTARAVCAADGGQRVSAPPPTQQR
ncbi:group II intron reverse transcriptase/maturase [Paraburkholderia youngii]